MCPSGCLFIWRAWWRYFCSIRRKSRKQFKGIRKNTINYPIISDCCHWSWFRLPDSELIQGGATNVKFDMIISQQDKNYLYALFNITKHWCNGMCCLKIRLQIIRCSKFWKCRWSFMAQKIYRIESGWLKNSRLCSTHIIRPYAVRPNVWTYSYLAVVGLRTGWIASAIPRKGSLPRLHVVWCT